MTAEQKIEAAQIAEMERQAKRLFKLLADSVGCVDFVPMLTGDSKIDYRALERYIGRRYADLASPAFANVAQAKRITQEADEPSSNGEPKTELERIRAQMAQAKTPEERAKLARIARDLKGWGDLFKPEPQP